MIEAHVSKAYPGCVALADGALAVTAGTVHAIVGENGAGKSTLVKILAGILRSDGGSLALDGRPVDLVRWNRTAARAAGIGIVQQHGASAGTLTVVENAVLGAEPTRGRGLPILELEATAAKLAELGARVGLPIEPHTPVEQLSLGAAQRAEIVAALYHGAKVLVLDEPTAVLAPVEVEGLLATLRALAASGTTIVIVTHKLDEVRAVADAVTVLRAGATVATFTAPLDTAAIARAMVGADLPSPEPLAAPDAARRALALEGVTVGAALEDVSLEVQAGEIVGIAGVDGNGQRELALAIAGLVPARGRVALGDRDVTRASPRQRLDTGLAHIPEDRQHGGLLLDATVAHNLALGRHDVTGRWRVDRAAVRRHAEAQIRALDIRPPDPDALARSLSGGNQQKVVIGRELSRPGVRLVLAAQPTRGVDLGAVARIHERLRGAAASGAGVLLISADLDELLALCHRVHVLLRGRLVGSLAGEALHAAGARAALGGWMTGAAGEAGQRQAAGRVSP